MANVPPKPTDAARDLALQLRQATMPSHGEDAGELNSSELSSLTDRFEEVWEAYESDPKKQQRFAEEVTTLFRGSAPGHTALVAVLQVERAELDQPFPFFDASVTEESFASWVTRFAAVLTAQQGGPRVSLNEAARDLLLEQAEELWDELPEASKIHVATKLIQDLDGTEHQRALTGVLLELLGDDFDDWQAVCGAAQVEFASCFLWLHANAAAYDSQVGELGPLTDDERESLEGIADDIFESLGNAVRRADFYVAALKRLQASGDGNSTQLLDGAFDDHIRADFRWTSPLHDSLSLDGVSTGAAAAKIYLAYVHNAGRSNGLDADELERLGTFVDEVRERFAKRPLEFMVALTTAQANIAAWPESEARTALLTSLAGRSQDIATLLAESSATQSHQQAVARIVDNLVALSQFPNVPGAPTAMTLAVVENRAERFVPKPANAMGRIGDRTPVTDPFTITHRLRHSPEAMARTRFHQRRPRPSARVQTLQRLLNGLGYRTPTGHPLNVHGYPNAAVLEGVRWFERTVMGLEGDQLSSARPALNTVRRMVSEYQKPGGHAAHPMISVEIDIESLPRDQRARALELTAKASDDPKARLELHRLFVESLPPNLRSVGAALLVAADQDPMKVRELNESHFSTDHHVIRLSRIERYANALAKAGLNLGTPQSLGDLRIIGWYRGEQRGIDGEVANSMMDLLHFMETRGESKRNKTFWERASKYDDLIAEAAEKVRIPPHTLWTLMWIESGFDPNKTSSVGAAGLLQLMPKTAEEDLGLHVDREDKSKDERYNARKNVFAAARYLRTLYDQFASGALGEGATGAQAAALMALAYNGGQGMVRRVALQELQSHEELPLEQRADLPVESAHYAQMYHLLFNLARVHGDSYSAWLSRHSPAIAQVSPPRP